LIEIQYFSQTTPVWFRTPNLEHGRGPARNELLSYVADSEAEIKNENKKMQNNALHIKSQETESG